MADHRSFLERALLNEWQRPTFLQLVLRPMSWLYGALFALRGRPQKPQARGVPIIVVGNITVGGAGKTPLVVALVESLARKGLTPGVIMRGYGGKRGLLARPYMSIIGNEQRDATFVWSDEQKLISQRTGCPVAADANRLEAVAALLARYPKTDVIVSDDGLQHAKLARDFEIVVIDADRGLGNGQLLPAGPLRESAGRLATVDAIVLNGAGDVALPASSTLRYRMQLGGETFVHCESGATMTPPEFVAAHSPRRIHALAGIGNPVRFFEHLNRLGVAARTHAFTDHRAFTPRDVDFAESDVIVMTEKDSVRLGRLVNAKHWYMRVSAQLPPDFFAQVLAQVEASQKKHHG